VVISDHEDLSLKLRNRFEAAAFMLSVSREFLRRKKPQHSCCGVSHHIFRCGLGYL